jgi:hypothetical protein
MDELFLGVAAFLAPRGSGQRGLLRVRLGTLRGFYFSGAGDV